MGNLCPEKAKPPPVARVSPCLAPSLEPKPVVSPIVTPIRLPSYPSYPPEVPPTPSTPSIAPPTPLFQTEHVTREYRNSIADSCGLCPTSSSFQSYRPEPVTKIGTTPTGSSCYSIAVPYPNLVYESENRACGISHHVSIQTAPPVLYCSTTQHYAPLHAQPHEPFSHENLGTLVVGLVASEEK